ncbi:amino acid transporter-like protein [Xylariaceae sp. FL0804]|nr:amino acid transporter-like protein [Xylariaceae sp. FL0804]
MVPAPLEPESLVSPRRASWIYASDAISSAASPLRDHFQLSCRSPLTPRRPIDVQHAETAAFLTVPEAFSSPGDLSDHDTAYTERRSSLRTSGSPSSTAFSPSEQTWNLLPTTPALLEKPDEEEGKLGVWSAINIIVGKTLGVGAYTIPSAVFSGVGSVGMSLSLWIIGSLVSFCGLAVYLDLGTAIPKSGGERVYLERIFRRPYMLATCMFMSYVVLLGFSAPNAIVLGEYALYAVGIEKKHWNVRAIAVLAVSGLCYVHSRCPRTGLKLINVLGMGKLAILAFVVVSGVAGGIMGLGAESPELALDVRRPDPFFRDPRYLSTAQRNFGDLWEGSSMEPYNYATALLKVIYCFRGYSTANQVLSEVRNPVRTLRVAAPVALGIVSVAYLAVNVAFFLVVDKADFKASGVTVAGIFFRNLFGEALGAHVLPFFVIISAAGNIAATSFAQARVNEELARDGLLPFAAFWATPAPKVCNCSCVKGGRAALASKPKPTPPPPSRGLLLHWLVSVAVVVLPPTDRIYNFLVDIGGYPVSVVSVAISAGLLHLQLSPRQRWRSPFPARRAAVVAFLAANAALLALPWIPPAAPSGAGDKGEEGDGSAAFPYYAYPATALAVLASGAVFWCVGRRWRRTGAGSGSGSGTRRTAVDADRYELRDSTSAETVGLMSRRGSEG